jgi:PIN domain nuclease of toxin-antitoxin system
LSADIEELLLTRSDDCWLSPISIWEAGILEAKGKLTMPGGFQSWLEESLEVLPLRSAPLTHEVARTSFRLDLEHSDPADRFLGATAQIYELTLVTADRKLLASESFSTLRAD